MHPQTNPNTSRTPYPKELRFSWYRAAEKHGWTVTETCSFYGIPRKTYYSWYVKDHGHSLSTYRSRKPHPNTKITPTLAALIAKTKQRTNYGPHKMAMFLKIRHGILVSHTAIHRFYRKRRLIRKPQKRLSWYAPMKEKLTVSRPGEGVQMDVKYVYGRKGKREYLFSVLDPYTKRYHGIVFPTRESRNAISAFREAQRIFHFPILSVQTDNGSEFRGNFHGWLENRNIPHFFIPKSSPVWNAHVERIHRTVDEEYYHNPYRPWQTLQAWMTYYNTERIHFTLKGLTPQEKTLKSVTLDC